MNMAFPCFNGGLGIDAEDGRRRERSPGGEVLSFNGASASMPQDWALPCRSSRLAGCFNGASASMPRMGRLTGLDATGIWRLQRGLGIDAEDGMRRCRQGSAPCCFNGASASMPRMEVDRMHDTVLTAVLQRGLGIDAEDGRVGRLPRTCSGKLQRGLGIDAEDGWQAADGHARAVRFNGASASMPRMCSVGVTWALRTRASTGPRHRCRGWSEGRASGRHRAGAASTGPRHRCRGWATTRPPLVMPSFPLQRGLGIDAEDGCRAGTHAETLGRLQRGLGIDAEDGKWRLNAAMPEDLRLNGASASMPRMGNIFTSTRPRTGCFNGASASLPRIAIPAT